MVLKKAVAPIIVTIIMILYFALYFGVLIYIIPSIWIKIALAIFPVCFAGLIVYVCVQRINEIRSGEEDDISKY